MVMDYRHIGYGGIGIYLQEQYQKEVLITLVFRRLIIY